MACLIDYLHSSSFKSDEFCRSLECFDEILISKLKAYVGELESKHTLIVLHQLGSHGPTYYKRVPETLKKFRPECATAELNTCSRDEILNAYDNTIYYTDYILGQLIDFLKTQEDRFETSMLYVSDHGESTGEYGLYLHGMPYAFAPSEQTHVPMFAWLSQEYALSKKIDRGCMDLVAKNTFSHDNLFHTLLNMTDVKTNEYIPEMSVFDGCTGDSP
ncbi:MAG: phosphoethanolamine transferase [Alphaproteobacteria bacterium]